MRPTDQTRKLHIILITAALALVGFFLEVGPVSGAFDQTLQGLGLEFPVMGYLAYLALAAAAAIGLHPAETEPTPKEGAQEPSSIQPRGEGEMVGEQVRVRPELHQLRMFVTALGGYVLLKAFSFILLWPAIAGNLLLRDQLFRAFQFGFVYIALCWFVLWQFLRWYAQRHRWVRLQAELVGGDVVRVVALVILIQPLVFVARTLRGGIFTTGPLGIMAILLELAVVVMALILWAARPLALRRTIIALAIDGAVIVILTLLLASLEHAAAVV